VFLLFMGDVMSDLTPAAMALFARCHGVASTSGLRESGVGRSTTERLVRAHVLRQEHKSVYVLTAAPATFEQRCAIVCAAHPSGFLTSTTAGVLLPLRRMPPRTGIHLATRHGVHLPVELGVVLHQTTALFEHHVLRRPDGISVARPPRLAFDLSIDLLPIDHLSVIHQLIEQRHTTFDELVAIGDQLCHPARRGSVRFRESLARFSGGDAADSHPEVVLAEALRDRGVPVEHQSRVVRVARGKTAKIDLAVPAVQWGVELDIHPEHRSLDGHRGDARRYRDLHGADWQVEPVSEGDMRDVAAVADELAGLYRARRRQFAERPSVS
jgi:hypothetical protein